ncbi:hypothetical protein CPAV1605_984 [seawater metagenome]|uniref:O-methyltransferase n=1 Tax=seawater metagenome TaxID=1561972 RepID=A0A5E8CKN4_9ZZZZ
MDYVNDFNFNSLHSIQKEILRYNLMNETNNRRSPQITHLQAFFLQFLIKTNNIKSILEIGTYTGFSGISMVLVRRLLPISTFVLQLQAQ